MTRQFTLLLLLAASLGLAACTSSNDEDAASKPAAAVVVPVAPKGADDKLWKNYLQDVIRQNMAGVTDRVSPYYLPANSIVVPPDASDGKSQYDRQLENVSSVIARSVLPGNMLVFGSPDSSKMGDLVVAAFTGVKPDALKGSQVLFVGSAADKDRVQAAVEASGAKYIFVEAK